MNTPTRSFDTEAIHRSGMKDTYGALITPIYNSSTFIFDSTAQGAARFALEERGYIYSRLGNPTCAALEETMARLEGGNEVERVFYPGLESHEGHEIAKRQMRGFGGVISFIVKGGRTKAATVADSVRVATLAVSLGATETLIEHPASMTHSPYTEEELEIAGIPAGLIRFSVGLEDPEDIIADLEQAFSKI